MDTLKPYSHSATGYVGPAGTVASQINKFAGFVVTTALGAGGAILIRNGPSGTIVGAIPASSAIGYSFDVPIPILCPLGVYFDLNGGTGTVTVYAD